MGERLSELERDMLRFAAAFGGAYCGYNKSVRRRAARLEALGYGKIGEGDLGPAFRITPAGRAALEASDG